MKLFTPSIGLIKCHFGARRSETLIVDRLIFEVPEVFILDWLGVFLTTVPPVLSGFLLAECFLSVNSNRLLDH